MDSPPSSPSPPPSPVVPTIPPLGAEELDDDDAGGNVLRLRLPPLPGLEDGGSGGGGKDEKKCPRPQISLPFPPLRLPVCGDCKRNFRTRDWCRSVRCHAAPPWTAAYVCVSLDDSCLGADGRMRPGVELVADPSEGGQYRVADGPEDLLPPSKEPIKGTGKVAARRGVGVKLSLADDADAPCCPACKGADLGRVECREERGHGALPWNTVFVRFSAADGGGYKGGEDGEDEGEDIEAVKVPTRTFLWVISTKRSSVHWLEPGMPADRPEPSPGTKTRKKRRKKGAKEEAAAEDMVNPMEAFHAQAVAAAMSVSSSTPATTDELMEENRRLRAAVQQQAVAMQYTPYYMGQMMMAAQKAQDPKSKFKGVRNLDKEVKAAINQAHGIPDAPESPKRKGGRKEVWEAIAHAKGQADVAEADSKKMKESQEQMQQMMQASMQMQQFMMGAAMQGMTDKAKMLAYQKAFTSTMDPDVMKRQEKIMRKELAKARKGRKQTVAGSMFPMGLWMGAQAADGPKVKRKRGRPRKHEVVEPKPKRKRGRPRKDEKEKEKAKRRRNIDGDLHTLPGRSRRPKKEKPDEKDEGAEDESPAPKADEDAKANGDAASDNDDQTDEKEATKPSPDGDAKAEAEDPGADEGVKSGPSEGVEALVDEGKDSEMISLDVSC
ncbi:hypothetical protein ACHAWF_010599 [Thalassiosira exigua]